MIMEREKKEAVKNNIGRLCLKLKINPKPEPRDDINKLKPADRQDEDEELPFVCQVCNKRYKSGKALGGHKRMHNLPPKDNNNRPKKNNNTIVLERKADGDDQEEDEPVCPLCEKSFPSMKSLFGHMRSHPDRSWRGIQPPSSYSSSVIKQGSSMITLDDHHMIDEEDDETSPSATPKVLMPSSSHSPKTPPPTTSDDHKEDLTKSLKDGNWSITAKRGTGNSTGCSSFSSAASSFVDLMDNRMKEAVIDLMSLAHQKPRSEFLSVLNWINKNKGKIEEKEEEEENSVEEDCITKKIKNKNMKSKKRRKKMKLADLEEEEEEDEGQVITTSTSNKAKLPSSSNSGQYVCSVCKRSFPSYQALGGHRSSHNKTTTTATKKKNIIINNCLSSSDDDDLSRSMDETATIDHDKDDDDGGGDQIYAQKGDSKIARHFDLNELPPLED